MRRRLVWCLALLTFLQAKLLPGQKPNTSLDHASRAFRSGTDAYAKGDLNEADRQFSRAVQLAPAIEEGHSALGVVLCAEGKYPQAIAELKIALKLKPGDRNAEENLVRAYTQTGANDKAGLLFQSMDRDGPLSPELLELWARNLAAVPNLTAAIDALNRAVAADLGNAELLDQLGSLYAQAQR